MASSSAGPSWAAPNRRATAPVIVLSDSDEEIQEVNAPAPRQQEAHRARHRRARMSKLIMFQLNALRSCQLKSL